MSLLAKDRQESAGHIQQSKNIRFELLTNLGIGHFFNRAKKPVSSIIDYHINLSEAGNSLLDRANAS